MMPGESSRKDPKYCLHRPSGRAFVTLDGRRIYLGRHGTQESLQQYHKLLSEWHATGEQPNGGNADDLNIVELIGKFWEHAHHHYRKRDGTHTSEVECFRIALRPLRELYGQTLAEEFGPKQLITVRHCMIVAGWTRNSINRHIGRIRHVFGWAVEQQYVPADVWNALKAVRPLQRGRSAARESAPVRPVPKAYIHAVEPYVARQVWALIQLQLLTGARAGELVIMRPVDIDTSSSPWIYTPADHKNAHRGHERTIYLGPKAQAIVAPFLRRDVQAYLFSPAEAEADRRAAVHEQRTTPLHLGNRPGSNRTRRPRRKPGERYTVDSYRRAIYRAVDAANRDENKRAEREERKPKPIARWSPHQLRHTAGSDLRRKYGLDAARVILGHRSASTTEIYAEIDQTKAEQIIARIG